MDSQTIDNVPDYIATRTRTAIQATCVPNHKMVGTHGRTVLRLPQASRNIFCWCVAFRFGDCRTNLRVHFTQNSPSWWWQRRVQCLATVIVTAYINKYKLQGPICMYCTVYIQSTATTRLCAMERSMICKISRSRMHNKLIKMRDNFNPAYDFKMRDNFNRGLNELALT